MRGQGKFGQGKKAGVVLMLSPDEILPNRYQPRREFDARELQGLAESIRENGILQPLTVRRSQGGCYELIAGERRLRAAQLAGLETLPCLLAQASDERSAVLALVENLQRQDLGFFEEAEGIARLMETCAFTQEQMAKSLGLAPSTLSNKLRLLKLSPETRAEIHGAGLAERHARALLRLEEPQRRQVLRTVIEKRLNVQETDKLIDALLTAAPPKRQRRPAISLVRDVRLFVNTIHHAVETMRRSGIAALAESSESGEYLVYTVRIPRGDAVAAGPAVERRERRKAS
ncbi:MAG: ParB/RepB/Spo0J family partition protein [Oscillospiraceae bacterium]|jgi:ParB family chromosome partitioning protein|nr:ParB/RepB/Spo0J family partition protein [Oscillospiraceae bacterium]